MDRQTDSWTEMQIDTQADRQTGRQADRHKSRTFICTVMQFGVMLSFVLISVAILNVIRLIVMAPLVVLEQKKSTIPGKIPCFTKYVFH